jgi:hypothetical protein
MLLVSGCGAPPSPAHCTDVGPAPGGEPRACFEVAVEGGGALPQGLALAVFDPHRCIYPTDCSSWPTAGTNDAPRLVIVTLPAGTPSELVRIAITDGAQLKGDAFALAAPGPVAAKPLVLSPTTPDRDGDFVPDEIDDCAWHANSDQADADGNLLGDACDCRPNGFGLLCEDFEAGPSAIAPGNPAGWSIKTMSNGTVTVEGALVHQGSYALQAHAEPSSNQEAQIEETTLYPKPSVPFFARAWVNAGLPPPPNTGDTLMKAYANPGSAGLEVNGNGALFATVDNGSGHDSTMKAPFPSGKWLCVEWQIDGAGPVTQSAWIGGVLASQQSDMLPTGMLNSVRFGEDLGTSPNGNSLDVLLDDLVIDNQRIGCDAALNLQ